jgi:hypothetical protein
MKQYCVDFYYKGSRYAETFMASSQSDARQLILSRFPGCSIWNVTKV